MKHTLFPAVAALSLLAGCDVPPDEEPTEEVVGTPGAADEAEEAADDSSDVEAGDVAKQVDEVMVEYAEEIAALDPSYEHGEFGRHDMGEDVVFEGGDEPGMVVVRMGEDSLQADAYAWQSLTLEIACPEVEGLQSVQFVTPVHGELDAESC